MVVRVSPYIPKLGPTQCVALDVSDSATLLIVANMRKPAPYVLKMDMMIANVVIQQNVRIVRETTLYFQKTALCGNRKGPSKTFGLSKRSHTLKQRRLS